MKKTIGALLFTLVMVQNRDPHRAAPARRVERSASTVS